jgi:hypothetical protein
MQGTSFGFDKKMGADSKTDADALEAVNTLPKETIFPTHPSLFWFTKTSRGVARCIQPTTAKDFDRFGKCLSRNGRSAH